VHVKEKGVLHRFLPDSGTKQGVNDGGNICTRGETIFRVGRVALIKLRFSRRSLLRRAKGLRGLVARQVVTGQMALTALCPLLKLSSSIDICFCFKHFSPFLWGFACLLRRGYKKLH